MAASTSVSRLPPPAQIARGLAGVAPSELSKSPLLGILGVIMGAGIVTLTGRMITLGLADLKGHLGISFDDGAWVSSSYNIALMFILQGIFSGGLSKPQWILTFSAFFHTIRLFGGELGAVYMGHFIAQREKLHSNLLGLHVQAGTWINDANAHALTAGVFAKSSGLAAATGRAIGLMSGRVRLQAYTLSISDGFYLVAWACVIALLLVAMLRESPLNYGDLSALQQRSSAAPEAKA